jgi:CheY-like chemotaxis protein
LQLTLQAALAEEDYRSSVVPRLEHALAAVAHEPFDLILAELYVGQMTSITSAQILRRCVKPTPMGLLTTRSPLPADIAAAGFAFVLPMPFDLDDLLASVAAAIATPWTEVHERQARIVRSFMAAQESEEWMSALALCIDRVRYYPPAASPIIAARALEGKDAYLAYLVYAAHFYSVVQFSDLRLYPIPKGLAVRYLCRWVTPEDTRERAVGTTLYHFAGERIAQVGTRLIAQHPDSIQRALTAG